jgi:hypothetical protein
MPFNKATGLNLTYAWAILADKKAVEAATQVLHNAPLFDRRVSVKAANFELKTDTKAYLGWGWTASKDSNRENAVPRAPCFQRPTNIFQSVREGRRVGFDTADLGPTLNVDDIYKLLHNYNVMCASKPIKYNRGLVRRHCKFVDFATREEADQVVQIFNGAKLHGLKMEVSKYQIPLKHLGASWDGGLKGGHRSGRDQGSAVSTNYEYVSFRSVHLSFDAGKLNAH